MKYLREFAQAFRKHKYEPVGDGRVLFPAQHVYASGMYTHRIRGKTDWVSDANLLPTEGLTYMLDSFISSHAAIPLYLSLYANATTPTAAWIQSTYPSSGIALEIVAGTGGSGEGYNEATRVVWNSAAAVTATKDNYASMAVFTIVTATTLLVNGVALHTASAKGATTGSLISATRFTAQRAFANTDLFDVKYQLALTST